MRQLNFENINLKKSMRSRIRSEDLSSKTNIRHHVPSTLDILKDNALKPKFVKPLHSDLNLPQ